MLWLCVLIGLLALAFFGRDALRALLSRSSTRTRTRAAAIESLPGLSAAWLLAECGRLVSAGAAWPEIGYVGPVTRW